MDTCDRDILYLYFMQHLSEILHYYVILENVHKFQNQGIRSQSLIYKIIHPTERDFHQHITSKICIHGSASSLLKMSSRGRLVRIPRRKIKFLQTPSDMCVLSRCFGRYVIVVASIKAVLCMQYIMICRISFSVSNEKYVLFF